MTKFSAMVTREGQEAATEEVAKLTKSLKFSVWVQLGSMVSKCSSGRPVKVGFMSTYVRAINGAILSDFLALVVSPRRSGSNGF